MTKFSMLICLLLGLSIIGCEPKAVEESGETQKATLPTPYSFNKPDEVFELPLKLKEISGLGIDASGQNLYTVQDEEGILYVLQAKDGKIIQEYPFNKEGDYEGVESANGRIFAVKSNGTLFELLIAGEKLQEVIKHKFSFYKKSDIEGLGFDPETNCLLFSAKGKEGKGKEFKSQKGIYSFSLDSMKIDKHPSFTISHELINAFLKTNDSIKKRETLKKQFKSDKEFIFGPSGIAIHPITNEIYITSSIGKVLLVLDREGAIKHLIKLKKKIHEQPEGICFDQKGNLYISNEGKTGNGKIYKFFPK